MKCPYCDKESSVIDSRASSDGVRRRRECPNCKRRFTTYERVSEPNLKVAKRGGQFEPFSSIKLTTALRRIGRDRPALRDKDLERLAKTIEAELIDARLRSVTSGRLAEMVLDRLREIDRVAYERLAINYVGDDGQLRTSPQTADDDDQLDLFEESIND